MDQPRTKCQTGRGIFAAKYTLVSDVPDGGCLLKGESIGIQPYNPALPDNSAPDIEKSTVAIRGTQVGNALLNYPPDPNPDNLPYALGPFATVEPGADDFCDVPSLAPAVQDLPPVEGVDAGPDGGGGKPALPAVHFKYEWRNVRFYVTAAQAGVQMKGELTYTKDDCTAVYNVNALYPSTSCMAGDAGAKYPNHELCLPPDLEKGRTGSTINSDVATVCDPELGVCVLARDLPSNN
jgi:hypothetical protein